MLREYYDNEWGMPVRDEQGLYERISLEGFQAGLSWATILRKRPAFRAAFKDFDPELVALFTEADDGDAEAGDDVPGSPGGNRECAFADVEGDDPQQANDHQAKHNGLEPDRIGLVGLRSRSLRGHTGSPFTRLRLGH
jgi:hypothetical protein